MTAPAPQSPLRWHYGPTATDPDPGSMWCYDCNAWVVGGDDETGRYLLVCTGCGRSEPPATADRA